MYLTVNILCTKKLNIRDCCILPYSRLPFDYCGDIKTRTTELPAAQKLRDIIKHKDSQAVDINETEAQTVMRKSGRITPAKPEINATSTERTQTISATEFNKYGRIKNHTYGE